MEFDDFRRIVTSFADQAGDVVAGNGELLVQIRDETIEARVFCRDGDLFVEEHGQCLPASTWIVQRLARLQLLAERICSYVSPPEHFVAPAGHLLDRPDEDPAGMDSCRSNIVDAMVELLDARPAGMTSVVYLTSDAGEGKTSLIEHAAVRQAEAYKARRSDWLLVPIPLGGRAFLRFDDVVVSALMNRLRFQLLYYDAFLELVRLGVLVPAFDGFEEMIIESSSDEAISALGALVRNLKSAGTLLVSSRRAYFDYLSFKSQARLFDPVGPDVSAAFGRVSLSRWDRSVFVTYADRRGVKTPGRLFDEVATRLGGKHPVLTRAMLVRRLVDAAIEDQDRSGPDARRLAGFVDRIGADSFHDFVEVIVDRELGKWKDTSGDSSRSLLTAAEHHELLSLLAEEMWLCSTDALGLDVVAVLVDMFAGDRKKSPAVARQVGERITQHALLAPTRVGRARLAFDHDDFRIFYLGQALGRAVADGNRNDVRSIMDKGAVPASAVVEAAGIVRRRGSGRSAPLALLQHLAEGELPMSFVKENCGALTLALLDGADGGCEVRNMSFPADVLRERRLTRLTVSGAYFHATSLANSTLMHCRFVDCQFERIELDGSEQVSESSFEEGCTVDSLVRVKGEEDDAASYDPQRIWQELRRAGFTVGREAASTDRPPASRLSDDLRVTRRFLRVFLRATEVNESTVRQRLGVKAGPFLKELWPKLEHAGIVREVPYHGHGQQRRMKLAAPMADIERAMSAARGEFDRFVQELRH